MVLKNKTGKIAIMQIILLIVGMISISYLIGSEIGVVSAQEQEMGKCVLFGNQVWEVQTSSTYTCVAGEGCNKGETKSAGEFSVNIRSLTSYDCNFLISIYSPSQITPDDTQRPSSLPASTSAGGMGEAIKAAVAYRSTGEAMDFVYGGIPSLGTNKVTPQNPTSGEGAGETIGAAEGTTLWEQTKVFFWSDTLTWTNVLGRAAFAYGLYHAGVQFGELVGLNEEASEAVGWGAAVAYSVDKIIFPFLSQTFGWTVLTGGWATLAAIAIGAIVGLVTYDRTKYRVVQFNCYPWLPPTGGDYCEECNDNVLGCTEYQCRSLGAGCELINKGTEEELCVWTSRNDIKPPFIEPWNNALSIDYKYIPDTAISPPDRGVEIINKNSQDGCVEPYFPLQFGATLDEPGKCKIDSIRRNSFDEMTDYMSRSPTYKYNHSQRLSLPSPSALEAQNMTLINGDRMSMYVRCEDKNGNANVANFVFSFCVDDGPDTTPPLIVTTDIQNNMPIAYNTTTLTTGVYINEPSECRWSKLDKDYDDMENQMQCSTNVLQMNAQNLYKCSATLTGLKNKVENDFYFRCKDQPELKGTEDESKRNKNQESYKYTLMGTQPLVITSLKPNSTIKDATDVIEVVLEAETAAGYKEGEAICSFSSTGNSGSYTNFFETGKHKHTQKLYLTEGDYTYHVKCVDLGGNTDYKTTTFNVESDNEAPIVVRVYREEDYLKIITNENSSCVYGNADCTYLFDDGIKMKSLDDKEHFTQWDLTQNFYIKCQDKYSNEPLPNQCNIIARPFEIYNKE